MTELSSPTGLRRIGAHVGTLLSRDVVNRLARFAAAVLFARALSLEDFGILNTGIAIAGIAVMATSLGLNDLGAREAGIRPESVFARSRLSGYIVAARTGLLALVSVVALISVALVSPDSLRLSLVIVAIALTMSSTADWLLRGLERMEQLGNVIMLSGLTVLAGSTVLFLTSGSATSALVVILLGELVGLVLGWVWAGTQPRIRLDRVELKALLVRSWPLALSSLALYSYYANFDTILLAAVRSADEAGLYSAPYRVFLGLNAISIYTAYAFMPTLTRAVESGKAETGLVLMRRGTRYLFVYGAALLAGAELFGTEMLETLFGDEFASMGDVFVVLCIAIMWFSVGFPVGYALIARDRNRRYLAGSATGGILNLVLNLILIPEYGPIGAAAATAAAFVAASVVWLWGNDMLGRVTALELSAMTVTSGAAVAALVEPSLKAPTIMLTAGIALAVGWSLLSPRFRHPGPR